MERGGGDVVGAGVKTSGGQGSDRPCWWSWKLGVAQIGEFGDLDTAEIRKAHLSVERGFACCFGKIRKMLLSTAEREAGVQPDYCTTGAWSRWRRWMLPLLFTYDVSVSRLVLQLKQLWQIFVPTATDPAAGTSPCVEVQE